MNHSELRRVATFLREKLGFLDDPHAAGGAVRDIVLHRKVNDIDVATRSTPEEVVKRAKRRDIPVALTGLSHGTVTLTVDGEHVEVTTFRRDVSMDGRRATVEFADSISEDLARRDFTINAMALDMGGNLIDPFDGKKDAEDGLIRTVGDPNIRFNEDFLRIIRGIRFASRFGFCFEQETMCAMFRHSAEIKKNVAVERVMMEIEKAFKDSDPNTFVSDLNRFNVSPQFGLPNLRSTDLNCVPKRFRMIAFLSVPEMDRETLESLKISNDLQDQVMKTVHAFTTIQSNDSPTEFEVRRLQFELGDDIEAVRAVLRCSTFFTLEEWLAPTDLVLEPIVQGRHLIDAGFQPGPSFSDMITSCHEFQLRSGIQDRSVLMEASDLNSLIW